MKNKNLNKMHEDAKTIFQAGLDAVNPETAIYKYCKMEGQTLSIGNKSFDLSQYKNVFVTGCGKAGASMAKAIENILGTKITTGIINVKYDHLAELKNIKLVEAGHPVPDENGVNGSRQIVKLLEAAGKNDLVLCLISGGGSALLPLPARNLSLNDKQNTIKTLIACGATIHEINTIRKHMSGIKGGYLAQIAFPAKLISLILSDVVGDNLDVIASGPSVPDPSTFIYCMDIISKYNISSKLPLNVLNHISSGQSGKIPETPKDNGVSFKHVYNLIIGSNIDAISAAKIKAEKLGYKTIILSSMMEGDTTQVARMHTAIAKEIIKTNNPVLSPACVLSGGETTVVITGNGKGGRNQEFALVSALEISELNDVVILSGGTDGTDGPTDAAGAIADTTTIERAYNNNLDPIKFLLNNDSYHFFKSLNNLLITGPTNTNVMDLRILLVQ